MSIIAENLSHIYMKGTPFEEEALKNINLKIEKGEFAGIIGHTGSGKSTLVQHFNGLLKPTSGRVLFNGIDIAKSNLRELRRHIGIVFQYPEHQLFEETVYKDMAFGLKKIGLDEDAIKMRIEETIKTVGLSKEILEKSPFELSGGQKRRVAIAGVLAMNPEILILDEPTAGLDPGGRDEIFNYITDIHRQRGITIILVSHSMEDVARIAKRVIVMNRGRIEMDSEPKEVFKDPVRLENIGLSAPQITYFMKGLKDIIPGIDDDIYLVEDAKKEIMKYIKKAGVVG